MRLVEAGVGRGHGDFDGGWRGTVRLVEVGGAR